jgi:hypothetical protein
MPLFLEDIAHLVDIFLRQSGEKWDIQSSKLPVLVSFFIRPDLLKTVSFPNV